MAVKSVIPPILCVFYIMQRCYAGDLEISSIHAPDQGPLNLSPFTGKNRLQGMEAAKVTPFVHNIESYSGFFEVDKNHGSFMFFWYFPPISMEFNRNPRTPVAAWLQGGMGSSSLYGALRENGPIHLKADGTPIFNKYSWADKAHLVYFDNPVGAGYSFTAKGIYSRNESQIAINLYSALKQFLVLFDLTGNPLFITGESYAGKYIPALGALIHAENNRGEFRMNFQGVAIGNGFVDPPNMMQYGRYLYQLGFIDGKTRSLFQKIRKKIQANLDNHNYAKALEQYSLWIEAIKFKGHPTLFDRIVGIRSKLNYTLIRNGVNEKALLNTFLNRKSIKNALHANGVIFTKHNNAAQRALWPDYLKSEVNHLKLLMDNYRVLLYHGQTDIKDAYPLMINYLKKIDWTGAREYKQANRVQWKVDGELAGYFKSAGGFTELLIRDASHMVPADQPKWAQQMINNFMYNKSLND